MNTKKTLLFLSIALILLGISACSPATETAAPTVDTNIIMTSLAETAQAGVQETLTQIALSMPSDTPMPTFTETPMQTATINIVPISDKAMISVSKETNCRLGPDTVYERVGQLDPGVMAEVFAMDLSRYYYFIQNPNNPGTYCWVWGFYVTRVNENFWAGIPIYTPAFTPSLVNTSTPNLTTSPTVTGTVPVSSGACKLVEHYPVNNQKYKIGDPDDNFLWRVQNTSNTTWLAPNLKFIFKSGKGTRFTVEDSQSKPDTSPGGYTKLDLVLDVPAKAGTHTETWELVLGSTTLCSHTVNIVVVEP